MNILQKISKARTSLSKSELKVADVVLADPNTTIRSSIASLARSAEVSEPTVNRFCRSLDCTGFPDFKLRVAQSLANGTPYVNSNVEPNDTVEDYANKIFEMTMASLEDARSNLDYHLIGRAVDALAQAKKIEFYGLGASASVAIDAQHKFFRLNTPVVAYTDIMMQRMSAAAIGRGDVVVVVSYTGRTIATVEAARLAKEAGATVIGITTPGSPLAQHCSITLGVETAEDTDVYTPAISRLVHLTIVDVLATGVTLRRGPDFLDHLKRVKDSLVETRFSRDIPPSLPN
ncbi:transcriptional regulator HexR [Pseudobacteriovorax antillogorgiicola]|uniref:transcriptional regulator HexR n=1 Tax=Pseudobacteriovorax antillogorgiicola TaxID=1513793 RepID=UPI0010491C07